MENQNDTSIDAKIINIFFEKSPFAIQSLDENGCIIDVSGLWLSTLGYSKGEVLGKFFPDFLCEEYKSHFETCFPKLKEMGQVNNIEFEIKKKNGSRIFVSFDGKILYDENGKINQTLCFMHDISHHKAIEKNLLESENKYRQLIEQSPDSIVTVDLKGAIASCNSSYEKFTGYTSEELIGKHFTKMPFLRIRDMPSYIKIFNDLLRNKTPVSFEASWVKKDGTVRLGDVIISVIKNQDKIVGFQAVTRDNTERVLVEDKLRESEEKFRTFFEKANDAIMLFDEEDQILDANEAASRIFGYTKEEFLKMKVTDLQAPEVRGIPGNVIRFELENFKEKIFESWDIDKHGKIFPVEVSTSKIRYKGKDLALGITRDISERKRLEEEIILLHNAIEHSPSIFLITDTNGSIQYVNPKFTEVSGYTFSEVSGKNPRILKSGQLPSTYYQELWDSISSGNIWQGEFYNRKKDGSMYWEAASIAPVKNSSGEITNYIKVSEDITYKKIAEEALRESEQRYTELFHDVPEPIWETSTDGIMLDANLATSKLFGYPLEELIGSKIYDLYLNPEDRVNLTNKLKEYGTVRDEEVKLKGRDGKILDVQVTASVRKDNNGNLTGYKGIIHNITELKEMEEEVKEREATLKGIFSAAPIGINLFKNRIWIWSNKGMEEITGYKLEELLGKSPRFIYESDEEYERVGKILYKKPREKDIVEIETKFLTKSGTTKDVYIRNSPLDYNDYSKGYITVVLDITARKKSQKQLDENLEYFAHLVDHIRNPLAIMSGFTQVEIEDKKLRDRFLRQIERIEDIIKQLDKGWMDTEDTKKFLKKYPR